MHTLNVLFILASKEKETRILRATSKWLKHVGLIMALAAFSHKLR
jgi:hypothetical protein